MFTWSLILASSLLAADKGSPLEVSSAVIKVVEDVAIPAEESGVLAQVHVKEGQLVEEGTVLARIRAIEVELALERAKIELDIAARKLQNDTSVQFAKKSTEVAKAEYRRSQETNAKYPKTVSESELDRQRLVVERGDLEVKQAEHEKEIAGLTRDIRENEHRSALDQLARRTISSTVRGMVVEVHKRRGEWVQPGDSVFRIVRLDRLRVEGFLAAKLARADLVGSKVQLRVENEEGEDLQATGEVVFISPEIDPLNAQVRIWAEVENADLKLRPGMQATLRLERR